MRQCGASCWNFTSTVWTWNTGEMMYPQEMKNAAKQLMGELEKLDLSLAAFRLVKSLEDGVFKKEITAALDLFAKLPCPETAVNLIYVCPEAAEVMGTFTREQASFERHLTGPAFEDREQWLKSMHSNLQTAARIQAFLSKEATAGRVRVGVHKLRDQTSLWQRLGGVGIRKGWFRNSRQFLRETIAKNPSAFRAVIDMICIHGVHDRREKFWNGLGQESDAQLWLHAEVMFEIGLRTDEFVQILNEKTATDPDNY